MIKILLPILTLLALASCQDKKETTHLSVSFENLMGKGYAAWQNVETEQDFENLRFFKALYDKKHGLLETEQNKERIPKRIHFIWLGPKDFPRESIPNVRSWIGKHPDWEVFFWTDRNRPLPHPAMEKKFVKDFTFCFLEKCYARSDNYAEKADLLRYEILLQQGGVYVDHDVKCLRPFDLFNNTFSLYCGLDLPFPTPLPSSVFATNSLIGSVPAHPILSACISKVLERWDKTEEDYAGNNRDAIINRIAHRSFSPFGESVRELAAEDISQDVIVLPAFYFNAPKENLSLFAHHQYKGTWFENETPFEKTTRERLMYISKKTNKILLACSIMTALNLAGFGFLLLYRRKKKY